MKTPYIYIAIALVYGQLLESAGAISEKPRKKRVELLAKRWAPKVWLDKYESFFPSSVSFFLRDVKMVNREGKTVEQPNFLNVYNLPDGGKDYYLTTKTELDCPNCTNVKMLFGQNPKYAHVPVYTMIREISERTLDIFYWFFYPYNRGKTVCLHQEHPLCGGKTHQLGHHVGDWEHVSIRLVRGRPKELYVATHKFGKTYTWDGGCFRNGEDIVNVEDGHPVIFSARGSHGSWVKPGRHVFMKQFGIELADETSPGIAWDTWKNLALIKFRKDHLEYRGRNTFLRFQGLWGNKEQGCDFKPLVGACTLDWGPRSLNSRDALQNSDVLS